MFVMRSLEKFILISSLVVSTSASAASIFPRGCEVSGFGYNQDSLVLNETGNQAYYLIQNRSNEKIELQRHNNEESFMSPPLHATFEAMNWGAFASDVKNINFRCFRHEGENTTPVSCRDVLEVCQYPRVRFALSNMGNYWISTNKTQQNVIQDSVAKGIYLKW